MGNINKKSRQRAPENRPGGVFAAGKKKAGKHYREKKRPLAGTLRTERRDRFEIERTEQKHFLHSGKLCVSLRRLRLLFAGEHQHWQP